jgi:glucans biosynthesis protein
MGAGCALWALTPVSQVYAEQEKDAQKSLKNEVFFSKTYLLDQAQELSKKSYAPLSLPVDSTLTDLSYEDYVRIRARPALSIWRNEKPGFVLEPVLAGFQFRHPIELYIVGHDSRITPVVPHHSDFDFNGLAIAESADLAFSGFRVQLSRTDGAPYDLALFQGGTFFRALAVSPQQETPLQSFGTTARVLTVNAGEPKGEELPHFRRFYIEKPSDSAEALSIYALFDSESVVGVVHFLLWPGNPTVTDLNVTLFPRVTLNHVGLGTLTAAYLFGANDPKAGIDDVRSAAYDISGLQIHLNNGEWLWRPVHNPESLEISSFSDSHPSGFGLIQRDRNEAVFFDAHQRFERRPSVWIKPIGDWGEGAVRLFEVPSRSETNHNIISYWHPSYSLKAAEPKTYTSRIFWSWTPPSTPLEEPTPLAIVTSTHIGRDAKTGYRRFLVCFEGPGLEMIQKSEELTPELTTAPGKIENVGLTVRPAHQRVFVDFTLDPEGALACELRLRLRLGTQILTETWLYRWTP